MSSSPQKISRVELENQLIENFQILVNRPIWTVLFALYYILTRHIGVQGLD